VVSDKAIGTGLFTVSIIVILIYIWLVFFPPINGLDYLVIKITAVVAIAVVFGILAWIGYTLATTPPPKPIEEIEKEIEEELKKYEEKKTGEAKEAGKAEEKSEEGGGESKESAEK
jgi:predicted DNA-binding transcriptional regulator